MFDLRMKLRELREAAVEFADALDSASVAGADAVAMLDDAAALAKIWTTVQTLLAGRVAETGEWRRAGDRSPADYLAKKTGTSSAAARTTLETASQLVTQPDVEAAARRGELSAPQAAVIADAAAADPGSAARLVAMARRASLGELRGECARVKAAAEPDPEARHAAIHAGRSARHYSCQDGAAEIRYRSTPEEVAEIWAVVQGWTSAIFREAYTHGRRESPEAYAADALLAMARAARDGADGNGKKPPAPAKVIVRVDWDALVRGWPLQGETCEIAGVGPVPVSVVNTMIDGNAFLAAVVTRGVDVVNVAHLGRRFTAAQVTGMEWRDPTCAALGCNCAWRLEKDHREDWAATKVTALMWSDRLCDHHHFLKTVKGWALVEGSGKRPMVPPEHADHPDQGSRRPRPDEHPDVARVERGLLEMVERHTGGP